MSPRTLNKKQTLGLGLAVAAGFGAVLLGGKPVCRAQARADAPLTIYADALADGWQDWSWASHNLASALHTHSGKYAIVMTPEAWKGLYLHHDALSTSGYSRLELFTYGSASVTVALVSKDGQFGPQVPLAPYSRPTPDAGGSWSVARIPLADLGIEKFGGSIAGIVVQAASAVSQADLFVDDISLQPGPSPGPPSPPVTVAVSVDVTSDRHPISPSIYGMAFAPKEYFTDLRLGLNRWGGNLMSRYNWVEGNACSAAHDWEWRNRVATDETSAPSPSSAADHFVAENRAAGTATLLTIPMIGWVARDASHASCAVNVPKDGGAPLTTADGAIAGYDPAGNRQRTSIRSAACKGKPFSETPTMADGVVYQDEWVYHLVKRFGSAEKGGVRFYAMDNEPDLWDATHTDVHPARMGYDDMVARFLEYATAVKSVDPTAEVTGPVSWGWPGYLYSSLDRGNDRYHTHADRLRHGGDPFLLWFLKQVQASDLRTGKRTLDVLDVHCYPQGPGISQGDLDTDTQARRVRATRSLWDPSYIEESWVADSVQLIPRLKRWIAEGYPGTKIGISEWNFGADKDINGALAIADALGVYGREGVYFANYWTFPPKNSPGYLAFKLYRNADGHSRGFGDVSCQSTSVNPDQVACFAAIDTPTGELTLLLINKMLQATATVPIRVKGYDASGGAVQMWRLSANSPGAIAAQAGPEVRDAGMTLSLPASSATLVRVAKGHP